MMTDQELYLFISVTMAIFTVSFGGVILRKPEPDRKYYMPTIVISVISAISFGLMSQGILLFEQPGDEPPATVARILGYMIIWPIMAGYIGFVGGLSRRRIGILAVVMALVPFGIMARWIPVPIIAAVGPLFLFGGLIALAYLLLRPYNRLSKDVSGERRLLFEKLRNLLLVLWLLFVLVALTVDSALGFMDRFTSVFMANYLDIMAIAGFGLIVLRSDSAVEQLTTAGETAESESGDESDGQSESPLADAAD